MTKLSIWWMAIRPKTLWASVSPVLMGGAMAYHQLTLEAANFSYHIFFITLVTALCLQIGANFVNDYFDFKKGADHKDRKGPLRVTQAGLVTEREMKWGIFMIFTISFILGCYLTVHGGWPIFIIAISALASAYLYTGGPYPLAYFAMGDVFAFIFFGPVAVGGVYYLLAPESFLTEWSKIILIGAGPGFFSMALLTVNNLRDREEDKNADKKTLAVVFGEKFSRFEYILSMFSALMIPIYLVLMGMIPKYVLLLLFTFPIIFLAIKSIFDLKGKELNQLLAMTGRNMLIYSVVFSLGWILDLYL